VDIGAFEVSLELLNVFARGSGWSQSFKQYLADRGLGDASRGYRINGGDTLPWINADQLVLHYNQDVPKAPFAATYTVHGVRSDYTARLTFLDDRSLLLTFDRPLGDAATGPDGDRFHITDPFFGGSFDLRFNALPGDGNGSGSVLADDFSAVKRRFFSSTARPGEGDTGYNVRYDFDGSGSILANDFSEVKRRFFDTLPAAQPAGTAAVAIIAPSRRSSVTGELLSGTGAQST
jgi:hypothetical protein